VAQTFFEQRGFGIGPDNSGPVQYASANDANEVDDAPSSTAVSYASLPATPPQPALVTPPPSEPRTVAALLRADAADMTAALNGGSSPAPRAAPPAATPPRPSRPAASPPRQPAGRWTVQVGAFRDERVARDWLTEVNRRFRGQFAEAERTVQNAEGWYRSRFTGMSEAAAQAACAALAERRVTCLVIRPQS
jgi:D-alanyl-D-alanine carboxypeptidase (penicillin-binding protein 5/6)